MIKLAQLALLALAMLATLFSGTGFAFDGNRAGFILGIGGGGGYARDAFSFGSFEESQSNLAGKIDISLGYAPSNRLAITWLSKGSFYDSDLHGYAVASATAGLGITYFLSEDVNANFIQAVIGVNQVWQIDDTSNRSDGGFGLGIGVGREVSKNWIIGLDATWGRPESGVTTFGIGVYFSHIWY